MGRFRDALKSLGEKLSFNLEGHLINVKVSREGGLSIKQGKGSNLEIYMMDPEATQKMFQSDTLKDAVGISATDIGMVSRSDLVGYDWLAISAQESSRDFLVQMRDLIPHDDLVALSISMTIKKYEIHGQAGEAINLREHLRNKYGERGNRIYNLFGTGMLERFFGFLLRWIAYSGTWSDKMQFKELWEKCLVEMDYAIFVNSRTTQTEIISTLQRRLRVEGVPAVFIFGRTVPIVDKIKKSTDRFKAIEEEYQVSQIIYEIEEHEYTIGNHISYVVEIKRKTPPRLPK